jgi:hypothetical protein
MKGAAVKALVPWLESLVARSSCCMPVPVSDRSAAFFAHFAEQSALGMGARVSPDGSARADPNGLPGDTHPQGANFWLSAVPGRVPSGGISSPGGPLHAYVCRPGLLLHTFGRRVSCQRCRFLPLRTLCIEGACRLVAF